MCQRPSATLAAKFALAMALLVAIGLAAALPARGESEAQQVRIGVLAKRGAEHTLNRWSATADYLSEHLPGHRFTIVPLGFDKILPVVEEGGVEFVLANSSFYVELEVRYSVSRIATLKTRFAGSGYTDFGGVIFTRADRGDISSLDDLRARRFMAVEESSLGGFHCAWLELHSAGIDPYGDFAPLRFGGTHDAVVYAVRDGLVDAGTVRTDTLERMAREGKIDLEDYRVLNPKQYSDFPYLVSTALYPEWPIARVEHTSEELSHRVATLLLMIPPGSEAAIRGEYLGWTVPRNYQPVHEMLSTLGIGPYKEGKITLGQVLRQYGYLVGVGLLAFVAMGLATGYVARLNRRLLRSESALREARDTLELSVQNRTADLQQALENLEQSRRRIELAQRDWNDAFDAILDPIFIHDDELAIIHANPAYLARAGLSAEEVKGRPYWEVFPRLDGPLEVCCLADERNGRNVEIQLRSGEVFLSHSFSIGHADGTFRNAIHILKDVTEERRAEALSRTLTRALEQAREGAMIVGKDLRVEYANEALCQLLSGEETKLEGRALSELFPPAFWLTEIYIGAERDSGWVGEVEMRNHRGQLIPVYLTASTIRNDAHATTGYVMTVLDLREARHTESDLRWRMQIEMVVADIASRFVAVDGDGLEEPIALTLKQVGGILGADRTYVFDFDAQRNLISNTHEWCAEEVSPQRQRLQALQLADFPWLAEQLQAHEIIDVPDVMALPAEAAAEQSELLAQGVCSLLNVPMVHAGVLVGFIGGDRIHTQKSWSDSEIRFLKTAGEIIANALMRRLAEETLRRSEKSLAEAQHIAHLGNWQWDIVADTLSWSDEIYRIFDVQPEEFDATYEAFLGLVHPEDRERVVEAVNRALRKEQKYSIDHRLVRRDGSERVVHENGVITFAEDGTPQRMVGTVQDVTDARHAEGELRRLNRALRTLSRGNEELVRAASEEDLLQSVCRVLVETGGYYMAWVGFAQQDKPKSIKPMAWAGRGEGSLEKVHPTWSSGGELGPPGTAIRTGRPCVVRNIATEEGPLPWRDEALRRGYRSVIALPLRSSNRILGALTIGSDEIDTFDRQETRLLEELANDLAFGIHTLHLRSERELTQRALQRSEERYHDLYESAPNAYVSVDARSGRLLQFNQALVRLLGYEPAELRQMTLSDLYAPTFEGREKARQLFARLQKTGEPMRDQEIQLRHKAGTLVWASLSMEPVTDNSGKVTEHRYSLLDVTKRREAMQERSHMAAMFQRALVQTIQAMALTIEKRDPYTAGHQQRVGELAVAIGRKLGLPEERVEGLRLGALIHDIGKIYVPAELLNRPGRLSDLEFRIIQTHPVVGYEIIRSIDFPWPVAQMVVQHHERLDGSGYPKGLKGQEIVEEARILAVADVIDAMATHRPYRPALMLQAALAEIEEHKGSRYDQEAVAACVSLFREDGFSWSKVDVPTTAA